MQDSWQAPAVGVDTMPPNQAPVYTILGTPRQSVKPQWYESYKTKESIKLGITQIVLGTILIVLNVVSIYVHVHVYAGWFMVGHGFWSGPPVIIAGVFAIQAGKNPSKCYIIASLVLSVIAAFLASISALVSGLGFASPHFTSPDSPIFMSTTRSASYVYAIRSALLSLMLMVSLAGCVFSIILSVLSCKVMCPDVVLLKFTATYDRLHNIQPGKPAAKDRSDTITWAVPDKRTTSHICEKEPLQEFKVKYLYL